MIHGFRHAHAWECKKCGDLGFDRYFCPNCGFRWLKDPDEKITIKSYLVVPRYYYHRPPSDQLAFAEAGNGLKAYKNKGLDGSTPAIERAFKVKDPAIIWLSPRLTYGKSYIVDISLLDENNIEPTGQAEGNIWHLGDVPARAIVGFEP